MLIHFLDENDILYSRSQRSADREYTARPAFLSDIDLGRFRALFIFTHEP